MDKGLLPKNFFRDNVLDEISPPKIVYFSMSEDIASGAFAEKIELMMREVLEVEFHPERKARIAEEQEKIAQLKTGEEFVKFIRCGYDVTNRSCLCKRIMGMQDEVIPLLLRRFCTSAQNSVIEITTYVLCRAEKKYLDQLIELYPKIRNPYAQCMACVALGIRKCEEQLPLFLREYERLKKEYPEENYCQGPLLAIYILYGKM